MNVLPDWLLERALSRPTFESTIVLFGLVLLICFWLIVRRRYIILILWPVLIYFCGPTLTSLVGNVPVIGRYIFPRYALTETLVILAYFVGMIGIDLIFDISQIIRDSIHSPVIQSLSSSPLFTLVFGASITLAIMLQMKLLLHYGSILQGKYAYWEGVNTKAVSYWGFLAGLYEIVFLCVVLLLVGQHRGTLRFLFLTAYAITAVLRVAGGTRLVLVKELAFIVLLLYLSGKIPFRRLAITTVLTILAGTVIGIMRSGGTTAGALGPLYGIAMESTLNSLSFNIAYQTYLHGSIHVLTQVTHAIAYSVVNSVPRFLRFGISKSQMHSINPYRVGLHSGFDSISPVGGMSGFATLIYVLGNPFVGTALLVAFSGMLLRGVPDGCWKKIAVLVFSLNALHFWRDGLNISVKLIVQDMLCALVFLYVPAIRRDSNKAPITQKTPPPHAN